MEQPVSQEKIQEVAQKIAREFQPEKIILFGSYAWGKPEPDSDVDFFVVKEVKNTRKLSGQIRIALWDAEFPMDIIVYTPQRLEKNLKLGDFFIKDIVNKGRVLYEKSS